MQKNYNYDAYIRLENILQFCKYETDSVETIYNFTCLYSLLLMGPRRFATINSTSGHQKWGILGKILPVSEGRWKPSSPSSWRNFKEEKASSCSLVQGTSGIDWFDTVKKGKEDKTKTP